MAIAWISGIENTSGKTYQTWSTAAELGGHTGKSPQYNNDNEWGNAHIPVPTGSNWTVSDCAIPFFGQGNNPPRRYLQGPTGTVYFDVTQIQGSNPTVDGIYCYNASSGAIVGSPIPVGPSNDDTANTTFTISMTSSGVNFVYQSQYKGVTGGVQAFEKAVETLAPLITAIVEAAAAVATA